MTLETFFEKFELFADAPGPANIELLFHKSYSVSPAGPG